MPLGACRRSPDLVQTPQAHYFISLSEPVFSSVKLGTVIFTLWHSSSISLHPHLLLYNEYVLGAGGGLSTREPAGLRGS